MSVGRSPGSTRKNWHNKKKTLAVIYGKRCLCCGHKLRFHCEPIGKEKKKRFAVVHHKISKGDGGTNAVENLILVCKPCHRNIHLYRYGKNIHRQGEQLNIAI